MTRGRSVASGADIGFDIPIPEVHILDPKEIGP